MTLCFYTKTIYALLEILGFLLLQMTTSENHDLLMPQKRARGSRQGMDTISRIRNSCTGVPLSSEPKRTPKPVRANLSALERRTGIAAVVASLVGTRSGFCEGTRWVVSAMGESVFQGDWHGKFMGRIGWRAHF